MRRLIAPIAVTIGGALLIWAIRLLPAICPAVLPAPPSCQPDARLAPAIIAIIVVAVLGAADILVAAMAPRSVAGRLTRLLLVASIVVGAVVTLGASGFGIPLPH